MPRVSVVIPTRNRLRQLQRALASVDGQSFRDREVLVVDDGSTDGTIDWISVGQHGARLVTNPIPRGAGAARNRGIEQARGELIAFLDDDDVWRPTYLAHQVRLLDDHDDAALSWADHVEVDASNRAHRPDTLALMDYGSVLVRMLAEGFIHTMSVVVCRKSLFDVLGPFDESLQVVQDFEWYARLLAAGQRFVHLPQVLVGRAIPGGLVTRHRQWHEEERRVVAAALATAATNPGQSALVRAYRALFFAHLAFSRGDVTFGLTRLADAMVTSPPWALRVAIGRAIRRLRQPARSEPWDLPSSATS